MLVRSNWTTACRKTACRKTAWPTLTGLTLTGLTLTRLTMACMVLVTAIAAPLAAAQIAPSPQPATRHAPVMHDIAMGMADAPVEIIEYASVTCAACQNFQTDILPRLKARYILTGQAKFLLRDHPTPPAPVSFAGFALARCAGESEFYAVIGDLFARQTEILAAARSGGARGLIIQIGAAHGLSEPDIEACIKDKTLQAYIQKQLDDAPDMTAAPAVFINGRRVEPVTYDAIAAAIDQEIAAAAAAAALLAPETAPSEEPPALPAPPPAPAPAPTPATTPATTPRPG